MNLFELLALNATVTGTIMLVLWMVSVRRRDASIVDMFWGLGFVIVASLTFAVTGGIAPRKSALLLLTAIWGLRLTCHLVWRNLGAPEDYRYRAMREQIGPRFWIVSLFVVFGLQWLIMNVVALPILAGQLDDSPLGWLNILGCVAWAVGFTFETVGDWQLARFRSDPSSQGMVLDRGLWRYTRHPNYFGDFMVWWGIYLVSRGNGSGWWTIVSPLLMSFLLLRVSGVTLLESSLRQRKPGYAEYVEATSAFFPWPPRSQSGPRDSSSQWLALSIFLMICLGTAGLGAAWTNLSVNDWFTTLEKPSWHPPNWLFGPVWTVLYIGIAIAAWLVWRKNGLAGARLPLLLFGVQLFLNAAWSALFFGMRSPGMAFADITLLWLAILATIVAFWRVSHLAATLLMPYLVWVSFATALNWTIWRMNP